MLAAKLALALLGLTVPLLTLELLLRVAGPILPGYYRIGEDLVPHPVYGHFHPSDTVILRRTPEYATQERFNSRGLRGPELPYEKPAGVGRMLVLGDSFVEGTQVDESQTLSSRLGSLLNQERSRTQVINGGVSAFGTTQEYLFFRDEAYRYEPDLVLLVVYLGNDVRQNSVKLDKVTHRSNPPHFALAADGGLRPLKPAARRPVDETPDERVRRLLRASMLFGVFETGVLEKLDSANEDQEEGYTWSKNERVFQIRSKDWHQAWDITEAVLAALKREVEAHGARLVLVSAPHYLEVHPAEWDRLLRENNLQPRDFDLERPSRRLAEIADGLSLPLIDLLPALRAAEAASPTGLYFRQDHHWNAAGHDLVAHVIRDGLAGFGLSPVAR